MLPETQVFAASRNLAANGASPPDREQRPGWATEAPSKMSLAGDINRVQRLARAQEKKRRACLRRDLLRVAGQLRSLDPAASALARAWASEVVV